MTLRCLSSVAAELGESPVWAPEENAIYWIDILGKKLHRTIADGSHTQTWDMPSWPGMVAIHRKGGLVIALADGLYTFDPASGALSCLVAIEADNPNNRANDGKCDAEGRLWLGTMNAFDTNQPSGAFYRIDADLTVTQVLSGLEVPNGLAWSPDDRLMYQTDSHTGVLTVADFNVAGGTFGEQRRFFTYHRSTMGSVDGAAMDEEGGYWTVLYRGGKMIRVNSDGAIDYDIPLPVTQPTMVAFGGDGLRTAFITTARQNLDANMQANQPLAGKLLALPLPDGLQGHPVFAFGTE